MSKQPEALRLASVPIIDRGIGWQADATATLKRQHALIADLVEALETLCEYADLADDSRYETLSTGCVREVARAALSRAGEQQ